jgi:small subunit ribosomal protein S7
LDNCKPILKLVTISRGGINYQVPVPMSEKEREFKATMLIISSVNEKDKEARFYDKLANELIDASLNQGKSIKKKVDIHKAAEANRAYAHFRWTKGGR